MVIGVVANAFSIAAGYDIGKPSTQLIEQLKYQGEIKKAKEILTKFGDRVIMPSSVAVRQNGRRAEYPVERIPAECAGDRSRHGCPSCAYIILRKSGTVVFNGPAGVFRGTDFATGTYELLRAASKVEFSVVGGGHTAAVIEKLGIARDFTHISTGGGACIEFLTEKKLPAVEALEESYHSSGE